MRHTSTSCDKREHGGCDGTALYMDQDGPNRYVCECYCHQAAQDARRREDDLRAVRKFMREVGLDRTHKVVEKASASGRPPQEGA